MMIITEINSLENLCTGCSACMNVCPKDAIKMELNLEGFIYPSINEDLCIKCGRCASVCQLTVKKDKSSYNPECYSLKSNDEIRLKSSSGGAFYQMAEWILQHDGIVYGAAYDPAIKGVSHTSTYSVDIYAIMRSKYVQSYIGWSYRDVETSLKRGGYVLFSGTPCQINGLKQYLAKDYDNLFLVDFVCHGVPSYGFFRDVIEYYEKEEKSEMIDVTFREKDLGWRKQVTKLYFKNGSVIKERSSYFYYYYLFLHNATLRKSCFSCDQCHHVADITLLDYWQIKGDDDQGVSAICLNSEKGKFLYNSLNSSNFETISIDFSSIKSGFIDHQNAKNYKRTIKSRNSFFKFYVTHGFKETLDTWYPQWYKRSCCIDKFYTTGGKIKQKVKSGFKMGKIMSKCK